jgi:hypothetical protein
MMLVTLALTHVTGQYPNYSIDLPSFVARDQHCKYYVWNPRDISPLDSSW